MSLECCIVYDVLQVEVGTASETTASELDTSCIDSESDAMRLEPDAIQ